MAMAECRDFFLRTYENEINKQMMFYEYDFPTENVMEYLRFVTSTPLKEFINYLDANDSHELIEAKDVFQFSNINDATFRLSALLTENDNPGFSYLDIGKLLLNDNKPRNDGAYVKYGENHAKTSSALGLSFEMSHITFVSCIGAVSSQLTQEQQNQLLVRLILRNKLIWRMYSATKLGSLNARSLFYMLSDSTYTRRKTNILSILRILSNCKEFDFSPFVENIHF